MALQCGHQLRQFCSSCVAQLCGIAAAPGALLAARPSRARSVCPVDIDGRLRPRMDDGDGMGVQPEPRKIFLGHMTFLLWNRFEDKGFSRGF